MTAARRQPAGRTFVRPVRITGPEGDWNRLRTDLAGHAHAVVHSRTEDWAPAAQPQRTQDAFLRARLGRRDWERYRSLRVPAVRERFAASRLLLKAAVAAVIQVAPQDVELAYTPAGRPYLPGYDAVQISLSHTGSLLLVGLATCGVIGVDAERSDRPLYGPGLCRQSCTPHEAGAVEALPRRERDAALVRLWTLKEAYSKAIGLGLGAGFTEFGFPVDAAAAHVPLCLPDGTPAAGFDRAWTFRTCPVDGGHTAGIAVADAGFGPARDVAASMALDEAVLDAVSETPGAAQESVG
ncbi:4'-phosphopantetheinyl transferase family protein [Streptomyces ovatisporus]|uniref:4'-phosphopantetheinyl transferase family protein n=1 Tax=Streptomyces ovatisporus TaxID=1128682 RepID=A0ABV9AEI9_9ACTN